jgi:hypothetical protein
MFELQTITKSGKVYLKRWRILGYLSPDDNYDGEPIESNLPFTVRLHQFINPDDDGAPHNHPGEWAISFGLYGGYLEGRLNKKTGKLDIVEHKAPFINFIRHEDYHMVLALNKRPVTLFITGPKVSSWGFWKNARHIPWKEFLGIN